MISAHRSAHHKQKSCNVRVFLNSRDHAEYQKSGRAKDFHQQPNVMQHSTIVYCCITAGCPPQPKWSFFELTGSGVVYCGGNIMIPSQPHTHTSHSDTPEGLTHSLTHTVNECIRRRHWDIQTLEVQKSLYFQTIIAPFSKHFKVISK